MKELFPYQDFGARWLKDKKSALLADDMGIGKSAQAIRAADLVRAQRVLVICPASARVNWYREFEKWSYIPRKWIIVTKRDQKVPEGCSAICSYDLVGQNLKRNDGHVPEGASRVWDALIMDESHFMKSFDTKRTVQILGKIGIIHSAIYRWALSGTPAPNHAGELWTILYVFGVTKLTYNQFIEKFCTYYKHPQYGLVVTGTNEKKIHELRYLLSGIMLRRRKEDVLKDLPPIFYGDVFVTPGEVDLESHPSFIKWCEPVDRRREFFDLLIKERKLLEDTVKKLGESGVGIYRALEAMCDSISTLRMYVGMQKVPPAIELVTEELENDHEKKIVIFAIHQKVIDDLRVGLKKFHPVTLYGGTPQEKRQQHVDKFQKEKHCRVFIGNIQAAGTAINLTAAHSVLFVEADWVPGNNAQAAMRCHRIGQKKPVTVRFMSLDGSVDMKVTQALKRKARQISQVLDEGELRRVE